MENQPLCQETRCPIQFVLEIIGSKWAILILRELFSGSRRTHEFLEALPGISTKTLTARLRELESYGVVRRKVFPEVPPRVEYSLTEKGREIQPVMMSLKVLGEQWLEQDACECPMEPNSLFKPESLSA
ncbi:helix-turn-helix domain-containing protein [Oscillatoria sp. CS-180]|uniref:winged helix-turn-helix transcriptional regulator n=1 Tax=Oscillatoria sp. CS-180 TaxID=3021720 RepID=UPI00232AE41A|nr:helix-turn-helix domain-containing protein [Oscillatoria sp. CS-180]MDB9528976.1 helix-turn-helix domain-containing protein [Oscillatoria sp. CS-180]